MRKQYREFKQRDYWLVVALWSFFQAIWYWYLGVEFGLESSKYIEEAQFVLDNHHLSQSRYLFYFATIAVIALAKILHLGLYGALLIIMVINLACYLYLFKALRNLFSSRMPALLTVGILLSFWPFQSWSLFLFTECLFYSLVLVLFSHLLLFQKLDGKFLIRTGLILCLLTITRPLGILFCVPTLLFVFFKLSKRQRLIFFLAGLLFLVLLNFVVQVVFTTTSDWNMTRALTEDSIICDMPRNDATSHLDLTQHPNQFYQLFYYVTHNFSHFAGLALIRLKYFFLLTRTYYSSFHNIYLIVYLIFIYGGILTGLKRMTRFLSPSMNWFLFSSIFIFAATIALQCDDYHNRFFLTLTPFLVVMAVIAYWPLIKRITFFSRSHKG